jgi:hypothetical protein
VDENESTSTTTPSTTATSNDELGVVGARAANQQEALLAGSAPAAQDDATLRLQALQVAQSAGGTPTEVMARADDYYRYLKDGTSNG